MSSHADDAADQAEDLNRVAFDQGTHILLVEDNEVNQMVFGEMLERLGVKVVLANNGLEAIDHFRGEKEHSYDLVFMDCQMPEMDGYKATRHIKSLWDVAPHLSVPIIALTAHAMPGDRKKCTDAGMDDYLSKPLSSRELTKTLLHWLPEQATEREQVNSPEILKDGLKVGANDALVLIDYDQLRKLEHSLDKNFYVMLMRYKSNGDRILESIASYRVESGNKTQLLDLIHNLKGSSASLGAIHLSQLCLELEVLIRNNNLTKSHCKAYIKEITQVYKETVDALAKELSDYKLEYDVVE